MSLVSRFKLVFFCPKNDTRRILEHLFRTCPKELGNLGEYEQCAFITSGTGQFKPKHGANPTIGAVGQLEFVDEDRVEIVVNGSGGGYEEVRKAIKELKNVHPYEEVAHDVYRLEDF